MPATSGTPTGTGASDTVNRRNREARSIAQVGLVPALHANFQIDVKRDSQRQRRVDSPVPSPQYKDFARTTVKARVDRNA